MDKGRGHILTAETQRTQRFSEFLSALLVSAVGLPPVESRVLTRYAGLKYTGCMIPCGVVTGWIVGR